MSLTSCAFVTFEKMESADQAVAEVSSPFSLWGHFLHFCSIVFIYLQCIFSDPQFNMFLPLLFLRLPYINNLSYDRLITSHVVIHFACVQ